MTIEAITAITGNVTAGQELSLGQQADVSSTGFAEMIDQGLGKLNNEIIGADKLLSDFVLNKNVSTHELMIAMEKAKQSMQLAVEVRNRLVEAYHEVTRMQV